MSLVLAGDIGGTSSRLAFVERDGGSAVTLWSRTWRSRDHAGAEELVGLALRASGLHPAAACLGVAGPVQGGACRATNLPWTIDARALASLMELAPERVALLNDVEAAARGLDLLGPTDIATLQQGAPEAGAARLLVSVGTGFGAALITGRGDEAHVLAGEPGHATFAPEDELERGLDAFVAARLGRASVERLVSGPGLAAIHEMLAERAGLLPATAGDGASIHAAAEAGEPIARESLELFARLLGSALGNLALCPLPRGGLFLAGGMPPRLLPWLSDGRFVRRFVAKSPMEDLLRDLPLHVVLREDLGLLGAARHAAWLAVA